MTSTLEPAAKQRLAALLGRRRWDIQRPLALLEVFCEHDGAFPYGTQKALAARFGVSPSSMSQIWRQVPRELARHRRTLIEAAIVDGPDHPLWRLAVASEWWGAWADEHEDGFGPGHDYWKLGIPLPDHPQRARYAAVNRLSEAVPRRVWRHTLAVIAQDPAAGTVWRSNWPAWVSDSIVAALPDWVWEE